MKTFLTLRSVILIASALLLFSCGRQLSGSATDTTGTNGSTNGSGKVVKSEGVHNYNTK